MSEEFRVIDTRAEIIRDIGRLHPKLANREHAASMATN
jgi:hypothetical protein